MLGYRMPPPVLITAAPILYNNERGLTEAKRQARESNTRWEKKEMALAPGELYRLLEIPKQEVEQTIREYFQEDGEVLFEPYDEDGVDYNFSVRIRPKGARLAIQKLDWRDWVKLVITPEVIRAYGRAGDCVFCGCPYGEFVFLFEDDEKTAPIHFGREEILVALSTIRDISFRIFTRSSECAEDWYNYDAFRCLMFEVVSHGLAFYAMDMAGPEAPPRFRWGLPVAMLHCAMTAYPSGDYFSISGLSARQREWDLFSFEQGLSVDRTRNNLVEILESLSERTNLPYVEFIEEGLEWARTQEESS